MVERSPLTFAIQELPEGVTTRRLEVSAAQLGIETDGGQILGPVELDLEFARMREEFRIRGQLVLTLRQECVRCLESVDRRVTADIEVLVRPVDVDVDIEEEPPVGMLYHDGESFSLAEEVRQVALVEIPANPVCGDECRGLCPRCGGNLNQDACTCGGPGAPDSRWSALASLKPRLADAEPPGGPDEEKGGKKKKRKQ